MKHFYEQNYLQQQYRNKKLQGVQWATDVCFFHK